MRRHGVIGLAMALVVLGVAPALATDEVLVLGGEAAVSPAVVEQLEAVGPPTVRVAGPDRYATAVAASQRAYPGGADAVLLASGTTFTDGLASIPLAATLDAPVLLTRPDGLPAVTRDELVRLAPDRVVVLGGEAAVSAAVVAAVDALVADVERIGGSDRYDTAALVAQRIGGPPGGGAWVVRGDVFADAVVAGVPAAVSDSPVLFVHAEGVPAATAAELARRQPDTITIVGGSAAVPTAVQTALEAYAPTVDRLGGANRYATSVAVADAVFGPNPDRIAVATGRWFPDTFGAGVLGSADLPGFPVLLVDDPVDQVVRAYVAGTNITPEAADDDLSTTEDDVLVVPAPGVLANDTDRDGDTLVVTAVDGVPGDVGVDLPGASGGTLRVDADGAVRFDPGTDFQSLAVGESETETVMVTVGDPTGAQAMSMLSVRITGANDPPAIDQPDPVTVSTLTTAAPGDLGLVLTATDPDTSDDLAWSIATPAGDGTASVDAASGAVDYLPDAGFVGVDTFVVQVGDGHGGTDTVAVEVTVAPPNGPPVITAGDTVAVTMSEDGSPTPFDLSLTADDPDMDPLSWSVTSDPSLGTASVVAPATGTTVDVDYAPPANASGATSFDVTVSDPDGASDTITVEVTVEPVNDPPVVTAPGPFAVVGNVGLDVPAGPDGLLGGVTDPDGTAVAVTTGTIATVLGGSVEVAADGGFTYAPPPGVTGADSFTFEVCDAGVPGSACATAQVDLTVSGVVWFVDNASAGANLGTLADPFTSLGPVNASASTAPVYVAGTGSPYGGGLVATAGQHVVGAGADGASLAAVLGIVLPPHTPSLPAVGGTSPTVAASGGTAGITLASGNTVEGLDVAVTGTGGGIVGTSVGALTLRGIDSVTTVDGPGLDLASGTVGVDVGTITVSSRAGTGIRLSGLGGTVDLGAATIPNPDLAAGYGILVSGGSADVAVGTATITGTVIGTPTTYSAGRGVPTNAGDGDGIFVSDTTGSFTLSGGTISSFADNAVDLRNATDVTLDGVTIDGNDAGNSGVHAHVVDGLAVIDTTIREIDNADVAPGVTDAGMRLLDVEGQVTIQRSTIRDVENYALANAVSGSANRAVELDNRNGCTRDGDADCTVTVTVTGTTIAEFDFQGLSLRHVGGTMTVDVDGTTADGANLFQLVNGAAVSTGPSNASTDHAHTVTVAGSTFDRVGIAAEAFGSRGGPETVTLTDNTVTTTTTDAFRLVGFNQTGTGTPGTYRATVTGNTVTGVAGHLHGSGGGAAVLVAAEDGGEVRALVDDNTFTGHTTVGGNTAEVVRTQNQRNGRLDLTFRDNTATNFPTNFFGAVFIGNDNDANPADGATTTCVDLSGNSYANAAGGFANTHAFDSLGASVLLLPGYSGTTDAQLSTYLIEREATAATAVTFGNQPTSGTCTLP